jgi:hypothetical protein
MVVSFHGGSPFQGFRHPDSIQNQGGTAASTFNYRRDTIRQAARYTEVNLITAVEVVDPGKLPAA